MNEQNFFNWLVVKKHLKESSLQTIKRRYSYFKNWQGYRPTTFDTASAFVLFLREKNRANATINGYINVLKYIDDYEREKGNNFNLLKEISYFPKEKHVPTILSIEEIQTIIDTPMKETHGRGTSEKRAKFLDKTMRLAIWFLAATGCRINEMATLTKENLSLGLDESFVLFKDTKTNLDRKVPLPPTLADSLKEWIKDKFPRDLVFTSSIGNKLTEQVFNPMLREKVDGAGINKHVYAHCFRNSYIMEHLRQGTDVLTIAKLVGHADVQTTLGYTKFTYEDIERGAQNHPFFSRALSPEKILDKVSEAIDKMPVTKDRRFSLRKERKSSNITIEISTLPQ